MKLLVIAVPCYNETEVLPETARVLGEKLEKLIKAGRISEKSKIVFINDGSSDGTWEMIEDMSKKDKRFAGISLSRNRGHQNALIAGLTVLRGWSDIIISVDADLQDDIGAIDKMIDAYDKGSDIVYGVRSRRRTDSFLKRFTAESYYKMLKILGCEIVFNHADFRLLSSRALAALSEYEERDLFLRGIVPMLGYQTAVVEYERSARFAGESKYTITKMLSLAASGGFSLSLRPVRILPAVGAVMFLLGTGMFIYSLTQGGGSGWHYAVASVWCSGGICTVSLGIVGEYVGRTYMEVKRRPRYHVEKTAGLDLDALNESRRRSENGVL